MKMPHPNFIPFSFTNDVFYFLIKPIKLTFIVLSNHHILASTDAFIILHYLDIVKGVFDIINLYSR